MASAFSHAVAALSIGAGFYQPEMPKRIWIAGIACSVLPDLDTIGFRFGVPYGSFWGHRGFTHSLFFAVLLAGVAYVIAARRAGPNIGSSSLFVYLLLASASHGVLDAMTNGGLGVAFFSPFDNRRYFLPWRPIRVSPISVSRFFTPRGFAILQNEVLWIWLPGLAFAVLALTVRRLSRRRKLSVEC